MRLKMRRYARPANISHAVRAQRKERGQTLDDFPTPPWATRALMEHVLKLSDPLQYVCWEPACGRMHMALALNEYFGGIVASDIHGYPGGYYPRYDFVSDNPLPFQNVDWVITNPPFNRAEAFVHKAYEVATVGVAIFARLGFLESIGRYTRLFKPLPPTFIAPFTERPLLLEGRLSRTGSTATAYMWAVWIKSRSPYARKTRTVWIPPCRAELERDSDYD